GKEGLFEAFGPEWRGEILVDGLGDSWRITQCGLKAFPTEALTHTPLTAVIELVSENDLAPDEIEKVRVKTIARAADILSDPAKYDPRTRESADHSLPYCISAAIVDRAVVPSSFEEKKIFDPVVRAQLKKIEVVAEPEFEALFPKLQPCEVTITTTGGRALTRRIDYPMGDPRHPIPESGLDAKFASLAEGVLSGERQKQVKSTVFTLEREASLRRLCGLLAKDE
ncbi:MAG TPA: MmgE/PrpD family protein, partial [Bacteroidetes bacterium]|nr:MmgE/PrpD family protein [Bacteroidota bacterium]